MSADASFVFVYMIPIMGLPRRRRNGCAYSSICQRRLEAACMKATMFSIMKLKTFYHAGTHYYYLCLLHLKSMDGVNAITDISGTPNAVWKEILRSGDASALLALEAGEAADAIGDADSDDDELVAAAAKAIAVGAPKRAGQSAKRRELMGPLNLKFDCDCESGLKKLTICVDGFSHGTKNRRAYAQCVQEARLF